MPLEQEFFGKEAHYTKWAFFIQKRKDEPGSKWSRTTAEKF
jgi:hypothetical protein